MEYLPFKSDDHFERNIEFGFTSLGGPRVVNIVGVMVKPLLEASCRIVQARHRSGLQTNLSQYSAFQNWVAPPEGQQLVLVDQGIINSYCDRGLIWQGGCPVAKRNVNIATIDLLFRSNSPASRRALSSSPEIAQRRQDSPQDRPPSHRSHGSASAGPRMPQLRQESPRVQPQLRGPASHTPAPPHPRQDLPPVFHPRATLPALARIRLIQL